MIRELCTIKKSRTLDIEVNAYRIELKEKPNDAILA